MGTKPSFLRTWLAACFLFGASVHAGPLAEDPSEEEQEELEQLREFCEHARSAAARYEMWQGAEREQNLKLQEAPILQWTNPVDGRQAQGEVFLWTDRGRAAVVVSIYKMLDPTKSYFFEDREFCSLAPGPLVAISPDHKEWKPTQAGIVWQPVPEAPPPRNARPFRLRQMRMLAERFTADKTTRGDAIERNLRLLPQPVNRYDGDHPDVVDGALFAFVEGTDPEAFLLIEARPGDDGPAWYYAFARMNSILLRGYDRDERVWDAEPHDFPVPDGVYTVIRMQ